MVMCEWYGDMEETAVVATPGFTCEALLEVRRAILVVEVSLAYSTCACRRTSTNHDGN